MDKEYIDSIAADLFAVLTSARESGMDVDQGFQHKALEGSVTITYMFYPGEFLARTPNMPDQFKRALKKFNVLAGVDKDGKKTGIFLICAMDVPFSKLSDESQMARSIWVKGFTDYDALVREALKADLASVMTASPEDGGAEN